MSLQLLGGGVVPTGTIISFMGNNAPEGYLKCDGAELNITDYPALANHFETEFGSKNYFGGDGETTFKVPDLQGEFLRCTGTNSHANQGSGSNVGVHQDGTEIPALLWNGSDNPSSKELYLPKGSTGANIVPYNMDKTISSSNSMISYAGTVRTSTTHLNYALYTAKPTNTSVWYCIKY